MEFTNDEKKYIFNCISEHTSDTRDIFDTTRNYLAINPSEFSRLTSEIFRMIEDMEFGAALLIQLHDDIEREDGYQSLKADLLENQELIQTLKYLFLKAKAAIDKEKNESF
jgi:hypothetical protein